MTKRTSKKRVGTVNLTIVNADSTWAVFPPFGTKEVAIYVPISNEPVLRTIGNKLTISFVSTPKKRKSV